MNCELQLIVENTYTVSKYGHLHFFSYFNVKFEQQAADTFCGPVNTDSKTRNVGTNLSEAVMYCII